MVSTDQAGTVLRILRGLTGLSCSFAPSADLVNWSISSIFESYGVVEINVVMQQKQTFTVEKTRCRREQNISSLSSGAQTKQHKTKNHRSKHVQTQSPLDKKQQGPKKKQRQKNRCPPPKKKLPKLQKQKRPAPLGHVSRCSRIA